MKFLVHTYGCQMNVRDSEAIEALMTAAGHEKVESEKDAQIVLVNSCTVRQKAEEKAIGKAGNLLSDGKIVGLMGCAVKRMEGEVFKRLPKLHFALGPRRFGLVTKYVEAASQGARGLLDAGSDEIPANLDEHPSVRRLGTFAEVQSYITVMIGCNNRCSYCIVPDVRGPEYSRPAAEVIAEAKCLAERGVKEICLLGQSVLKYPDFPGLLRSLQEIDGIERIRFTSAHPKGCTPELLAAYRDCPKVCRHLHLPVQSGSDAVLRAMGRRYTRSEYLDAVKMLRDFDPEFSITTDVIVGYPGESQSDFEDTRSLMEEAGFDNAFVFKYSPRPGTRSAMLPDDVATEEKERRDQVLLDDQESRGQRRNDLLVGSEREVMVEGPSKRNQNRWSGRDSGNRIVIWDRHEGDGLSIGDLVKVRINLAHPQTLFGELISRES